MFNRETNLEKFKDAETVIGASVKVKGNFHGQGNIVIKGALEGSLKTNANIFIGEKAKVIANVESQDLVVNGEIKGNVKAKNFLSLGKTARITGDISYAEMSMEKGAIINGQLLFLKEDDKKERRSIEKDKVEK